MSAPPPLNWGCEVIEIATTPKTNVQAGQIAALELHENGMPTAVICGNDSDGGGDGDAAGRSRVLGA